MEERRFILKEGGMGYNIVYDTVNERFIPLQEVVDKLNDGDGIARSVKAILGE